MCQHQRIQREAPICQLIHGSALDAAIGELLVSSINPLALETTLAIQAEVEARAVEADRLRRQHVERARHDAELAQHRYLRVHPDNRLVADALEAEWNARLRELTDAQQTYERQRAAAQQTLDAEQRAAILNLANDVPRLWRDPRTPDRERKRLARLLLEDVTLLKTDHVAAHVRFKGGATRTLKLPLPVPIRLLRKTDPATVAEIDRLLDDHTRRDRRDVGRARCADRWWGGVRPLAGARSAQGVSPSAAVRALAGTWLPDGSRASGAAQRRPGDRKDLATPRLAARRSGRRSW